MIMMFMLLMGLIPCRVDAAGEDEMLNLEERMLEDLQVDEMQQAMDRLLKEDSISVKSTMRDMINGEIPFSSETFFHMVREGISEEFASNKAVFGQVVLLALVSAVLTGFIQVFDHEKVSDVCFYIIYLLVFVLLLKQFRLTSESLEETLDGTVSLMRAVVPSYYIAVTAASGVTSAAVFHQIVLIVIFCVEYIVSVILMPAVNIYVLLAFINLLTKEEVLTKISELLIDGILWAQKSMLAVIVGMQVIQSLVAPAVDTLKRSLLGKTASVIPGVGNIVNGVTELILGAAVLIRNCFGATALIVLLAFSISPMIHLGMHAFLYKFTGAVLQPVCDSRLVGCFQAVGEGCSLLLKLLFTTQVLFMVTIVILANTL